MTPNYFGDEQDDMPQAPEKIPGVYVRTGQVEPHELDMLWSGSKLYHKEERSPLLFFFVGLAVGVVATAAVFLLLIMKPDIKLGENDLTAPVTGPSESAAPVSGSNVSVPNGRSSKKAGSASIGGRTYTVQNGDSLGSIAYKHYGSSGPDYVEKLQRANNLSSPDSIQIGQQILIPPKNY